MLIFKRLFISLGVCLVVLIAHGQNTIEHELLDALIRLENAPATSNELKDVIRYYQDEEFDSVMVSAYRCIEQKTDEQYIDYCHYFRAIGFMHKQMYERARESLILVDTGKFSFPYLVELRFGEIMLELEAYSDSRAHFKRAEPLLKARGLPLSIVYHNIGISYLHEEKYDEAEEFLLQSLELQLKGEDTLLQIGGYTDMANLYYLQYRDEEAIPYFEKAYALSKQVNAFEIKSQTALNMAVVEENREHFTEALNYRKEYEQWKDSLNNQNRVWELAQIEKQIAREKDAQRIDYLRSENKLKASRNRLWISIAGLLFILALLFFFFYRSKVRSNQLIDSQRKQLDHLNKTKDRLFSIIGHDLRSSVNALRNNNGQLSDQLQELPERTQELVRMNQSITEDTHVLLDNMLSWSLLQSDQLFFNPEPHQLRSVVEQVVYNFTALAKAKNIHIETQIAPVTVYVDLQTLKTILRNLIDNAIKYIPEGSSIQLSSEAGKEFVVVKIQDDGPGFDSALLEEFGTGAQQTTRESRSGLGLQLCRSMLEKNGGSMTLKNNNGALVVLEIPLANE